MACRLSCLAFVFLVVEACGGSVTTVPDVTGGTSSSSGASSSGASGGSSTSSGSSGASSSGGTSGSSGASGSGGTSSGGEGVCTATRLAADRACVPGRGAANKQIAIDVDASQGCLGCFAKLNPCDVTVDNAHISVGVMITTCKPKGDVACPAICMQPSTKCVLPPLPAGEYVVDIVGEPTRTGLPPRKLVVDATGGDGECSLPATPPAPLDLKSYKTGCLIDTDCLMVTVGNPCAPCACPNAAIAKVSSSTYEADFRARSSQCASPGGGVACAGCAQVKVKCDHSDGPSGICKLGPG